MRFLILAVFPVAALLAQAPPAEQQTQPKIETPAEPAPPAQAGTPQPLSQSQRDANREKLQKLLNEMNARRSSAIVTPPAAGIVALRLGQPCSVPLKNIHPAPAKTAPEPLPVTPGNPGAVSLTPVPLPAPSCDDVKR
jgi:hypothetical protein